MEEGSLSIQHVLKQIGHTGWENYNAFQGGQMQPTSRRLLCTYGASNTCPGLEDSRDVSVGHQPVMEEVRDLIGCINRSADHET